MLIMLDPRTPWRLKALHREERKQTRPRGVCTMITDQMTDSSTVNLHVAKSDE